MVAFAIGSFGVWEKTSKNKFSKTPRLQAAKAKVDVVNHVEHVERVERIYMIFMFYMVKKGTEGVVGKLREEELREEEFNAEAQVRRED